MMVFVALILSLTVARADNGGAAVDVQVGEKPDAECKDSKPFVGNVVSTEDVLPAAGDAASRSSAKAAHPLLRTGLGRELIVGVDASVDALRLRAHCRKIDFGLLLDGYPIAGIAARSAPDNKLRFYLERSDASTDAWSHLLGAEMLTRWRLKKPVDVAIGLLDGSEVTQNSVRVDLEIVDWFKVALSAVVWLGLVAIIVILARRTSLLRDSGLMIPASGFKRASFGTYSLGRTQMAWWTVVIVFAFLVVWCMSGQLQPMNASALALMGISSTTALGAAFIDAAKTSGAVAALTKFDATGKPLPPDQETQRQIDAVLQPAASDGLFKDILTDGDGYSLHRVQIVVWTLVMTFVFIGDVLKSLTIGTIDPTLLLLMGISNGTYVGFKFSEKPANAATTAPPVPAPPPPAPPVPSPTPPNS